MLTDDGRAVWFYARATKESLRGIKAAITTSVWPELKQIGVHSPCWVQLTINDEAPCFVYLRRRPTAIEFPILRQCFPWMKIGFVFRARLEPASRYARWSRRSKLITNDGEVWDRRGRKLAVKSASY